jgi:hypothetical protein
MVVKEKRMSVKIGIFLKDAAFNSEKREIYYLKTVATPNTLKCMGYKSDNHNTFNFPSTGGQEH